mgnify:CR=1 FL=1
MIQNIEHTEEMADLFISKFTTCSLRTKYPKFNILKGVPYYNSYLLPYLEVTPGYQVQEPSIDVTFGALTFTFIKTIGRYCGISHKVFWVGISDGMDVPFYSVQTDADMDEIITLLED